MADECSQCGQVRPLEELRERRMRGREKEDEESWRGNKRKAEEEESGRGGGGDRGIGVVEVGEEEGGMEE